MPSLKFLVQVEALLHAWETAILVDDVFEGYPSTKAMIWYHMQLIRIGRLRTPVGLKHLRVAVFTHYNEGTGPNVDRLWAAIASAGLAFERRDPFQPIRVRGGIRTRDEYVYIQDAFVQLVASGVDPGLLGQWLETYERGQL